MTIIFVLLPLVLGYKLWDESSDYKDPDRPRRIKVIVYGILGLFVWAGIIIGPVIAMVSAILPSKELY